MGSLQRARDRARRRRRSRSGTFSLSVEFGGKRGRTRRIHDRRAAAAAGSALERTWRRQATEEPHRIVRGNRRTAPEGVSTGPDTDAGTWGPGVSRDAMWSQVRTAWAMLAGSDREAPPDRERETAPPPRADERQVAKEGFSKEALPWLDAVYRFSLRLTGGDRDAAEDLVQETFLRAHRSWHTFQRGSNAKSWLFTICRNTFLHDRERPRSRMERSEADLGIHGDLMSSPPTTEGKLSDPEREFFGGLIDDEVVGAIDGLPDEFREVLVLSDLGDLRYEEIAEVLGVPVGTVKSRLFRARRRLQEQLREFAIRSGYVQEGR